MTAIEQAHQPDAQKASVRLKWLGARVMRNTLAIARRGRTELSAKRVGAFLAAVAVWCVAMLAGSLLPTELAQSIIAALAVSLFAAYIASYVTFGLSSGGGRSSSIGFQIAACIVGLALARVIAEASISSLLAIPGAGSPAQIAGALFLAWGAPLLVVFIVDRVESARTARRVEATS